MNKFSSIIENEGEMKMLTEERQQKILSYLKQHTTVKNTWLSEKLNTSISTIRRDLQEMEDEHLLRRIHGGATLIHPLTTEDSLHDKSSKNTQEKLAIAQCALQFITEQAVIFLDAGSTTYAMIPFLKGKSLTVVTNSVVHADKLASYNINTYIIGGMIKPNTKAIINSNALMQLQNMRFDACFIGANAIDPKFGYATPDSEEAMLKKVAIQNSNHAYVLADNSKIGASAFISFAELSEATLITDDHSHPLKSEIQKQTIIKECPL